MHFIIFPIDEKFKTAPIYAHNTHAHNTDSYTVTN